MLREFANVDTRFSYGLITSAMKLAIKLAIKLKT